MITTERHGAALVVTLSRPQARNAIDPQMAAAIERALDLLEEDDGLQVGIVAAEGPVFSAGADLKVAGRGEGDLILTERGGFGGIVFRERRKPLIAAVEGMAVAGGCEIVLACDLVVASRSAQFGLPEVKRALIAAAGGLARLPHVVGRTVAMEIALTGDPIDAARAHQVGLVNRLVDPGEALDEALRLAAAVAANAPLAVQETRRLVLAATDHREQELRTVTVESMVRNSATADAEEGVRAFVEKREPSWQGR